MAYRTLVAFEKKGITWICDSPDSLGFIPHFLNALDDRRAVAQFNDAYQGGWCSFAQLHRVTLESVSTVGQATMHYPGDPPMQEIGRAVLRDETIIVFQYAWVAVVQPDGSFDMARMD